MYNIEELENIIKKLETISSTYEWKVFYSKNFINQYPDYIQFLKDNGIKIIEIPNSFNDSDSDNTIYLIPTDINKPIKICFEGQNNEYT